ncbi:MAG: hypothetical protein ACKPKO_50255, partial [Candidatus Fonsibacter sp.]
RQHLGIAVRADTIPVLVEFYCTAPSAMPHNIYILLTPGERPLDKRGALLAISPEEMMHAVMAAVAGTSKPDRPLKYF